MQQQYLTVSLSPFSDSVRAFYSTFYLPEKQYTIEFIFCNQISVSYFIVQHSLPIPQGTLPLPTSSTDSRPTGNKSTTLTSQCWKRDRTAIASQTHNATTVTTTGDLRPTYWLSVKTHKPQESVASTHRQLRTLSNLLLIKSISLAG